MTQIKGVLWVMTMMTFLWRGLEASAQALPQDKDPCSEDIAKFCEAVKGDPVALLGCLEEHESELSDACKEHEAKMEGRRGERREMAKIWMRFRSDCSFDIMKFCKDVSPQQQGFVKCIIGHEAELSLSCGDWLKAFRAEEQKAKGQ